MKITSKGPANSDLSQLVQNDKTVGSGRRDIDPKIPQGGESTKVNISKEARELQRIAELAQKGDELRAEKVQQLKEQVASGQYKVNSEEVAKSIARSEVSRLLEKK